MRQTNKISGKSIQFAKWRKISNILLGILFVCFLCIVPKSVNASAAGATISITTKNTTVVKGDTVYVVITVSSDEAIKGFDGYFTYDSRVLQFITGGSVTAGNDDAFRIDDTDRTGSSNKITYSVKFRARKEGSSTISLRKPYHTYVDDDTASEMSISYNSLNISVRKKAISAPEPEETLTPEESAMPEASPSSVPQSLTEPVGESPEPVATPNAKDVPGSSKLRKLLIEDVELAPEFAPNIKKYSAIVTTDETQLPISYETKDSQAKVAIKGNKKLKQGRNTIKIIVTGTTGKKTTYCISLTVQRTGEETQASYVTLTEKEGKLYLQGSSEIEVLEVEDESIIPEGFVEKKTAIDGRKITAYALESGNDTGFVLIYGRGNKEEFFLYDVDEGTLFPYEKVKAWYRSRAGESAEAVSAEERTIQSLKYVIGIIASFCGLLLLIVFTLLIRPRKR